ncbi:hypothetical protein [Winogradskyella sp. PC D3.3]
MKTLEYSIKKRYLLFISTIIVVIITVLVILQSSVNNQKKSALLISKASNQCLLNERMNSLVYSLDSINSDTISTELVSAFKDYVDEFENTHYFLDSVNKQEGDNKIIDSLLKITDKQSQKIVSSSRRIIKSANTNLIAKDVDYIAETELPYFLSMQSVIREYQKSAENNLNNLLQTSYFLALFAALVLIGEFLFILVPIQNKLFKQNYKLIKINSDFSKSEIKIKEHLEELTNLKTDLEKKKPIIRLLLSKLLQL